MSARGTLIRRSTAGVSVLSPSWYWALGARESRELLRGFRVCRTALALPIDQALLRRRAMKPRAARPPSIMA